MFILLLFTLVLALVTEKAPEIQVEEMLLANDNGANELSIVNDLGN